MSGAPLCCGAKMMGRRMGIRGLMIAAAGATASLVLATAQTAQASPNPLPADPPRIPLTRSLALDLPSQTPDQLVHALYARKTPGLGKVSGYRRAFMPDLARALAQDGQEGDATDIYFDWRFASEHPRIRHLKFNSKIKGDYAEITARFRNRGHADSVIIQLLQRRSGWRIHDVGHPQDPSWSLRACLHMHGSTLAKDCDSP